MYLDVIDWFRTEYRISNASTPSRVAYESPKLIKSLRVVERGGHLCQDGWGSGFYRLFLIIQMVYGWNSLFFLFRIEQNHSLKWSGRSPTLFERVEVDVDPFRADLGLKPANRSKMSPLWPWGTFRCQDICRGSPESSQTIRPTHIQPISASQCWKMGWILKKTF